MVDKPQVALTPNLDFGYVGLTQNLLDLRAVHKIRAQNKDLEV
jgi:hypothetical protein